MPHLTVRAEKRGRLAGSRLASTARPMCPARSAGWSMGARMAVAVAVAVVTVSRAVSSAVVKDALALQDGACSVSSGDCCHQAVEQGPRFPVVNLGGQPRLQRLFDLLLMIRP